MRTKEQQYKHDWYIMHKTQLCVDIKAYHKTFFGKMMRMYLNMKQRVMGQDKNRPQYTGLPLLPRKEFYSWLFSDPRYAALYFDWRASGYQLKLTPTIDRLDKTKGYVHPNMEIVTLSENVKRRGATRGSKN